jgi:fibrillarin-like rRNA methylase
MNRSQCSRRTRSGSRTRTRKRKVDNEHVVGRGGHKFREAEYKRSKLMVSMLCSDKKSDKGM